MFWHPSENDLALAATHDQAPWKSGWIKRHVATCTRCARVATAYAEQSRELGDSAAGAARETDVPPFLAEAIVARIRHSGPVAVAHQWHASPLIQAAVALGIVLLAVLLVRWPAQRGITGSVPTAVAGPSFATPARAEAVVGAKPGRDSRGRVVVYGSPHRGRVEVSATGSGVGVVQADATTGTLTISAVSVEE